MQWSFVILLFALVMSGCRPTLEKKLVGEWLSGCSIDICTITALNADHTFSQQFDEKDALGDICSGSWHVDHDQLVLHVTRADKTLQNILGKELRYLISDFRNDGFVATSTEDRTKPIAWERRH